MSMTKSSNTSPKKISAEYFMGNRTFYPVSEKVGKLMRTDGKIEIKRRDTAKKFIELQNMQKESRKKIFAKYGLDMPLPEISEREYLEKKIPMDSWLYIQYGAIMDNISLEREGTLSLVTSCDIPKEERSKVSEDALDIIFYLEVKGGSMAEVNGAAKPEAQKEEPAPSPSPPEPTVAKEKPASTNKRDFTAEEKPDDGDVLAPRRREIEARERKRAASEKRARKIIFCVLALSSIFMSAALFLALRKFALI